MKEDPIQTALDEFRTAWFSERPLDPDTFCQSHPECGPELRQAIESFLIVAREFPQTYQENGKEGIGPTHGRLGKLPEKLGDFTILREIGWGGMGVVYEAEQRSPKRRVALKVLHAHRKLSTKEILRFKQEADAGARQSHPNIVAIYASGEDKGVHYIAQELVPEGFSLADRLEDEQKKENRQPPEYYGEVARLVSQVADALQHAHDSGVIHRDIKPSNILITQDGSPKVTDFGLAKVEDALALSRTGEFAGTPYYMSPEQALARRIGIDKRTDIYSLGVTFYEMLTLERPYQGKTSHEIIKQIIFIDPRDPHKLNSQVPRDLSTICLKAIEKDPNHRYQSMNELADDLVRFLADELIQAKPANMVKKLWKRVRRNLALYALGCITLVALLSLGILIANRNSIQPITQQEHVTKTQDQSTLTKIHRGIPSDVFLYWRFINDPELPFLGSRYASICEQFVNSNIFADIWSFIRTTSFSRIFPIPLFDEIQLIAEEIKSNGGPEALQEFIDKLRLQLAGFDWDSLFMDEFVLGVADILYWNNVTAISRLSEERASFNYAVLKNLLETAADATTLLDKKNWDIGPFKGMTLSFKNPNITFAPTIALAENILIISLNFTEVLTTINLISEVVTYSISASEDQTDSSPLPQLVKESVSLVESRKYRNIFEDLPVANNTVLYCNSSKMFNMIFESEDLIMNHYITGNLKEEERALYSILKSALNTIAIVTGIGFVGHSHDNTQVGDTVVVLAQGWKKHPLFECSQELGFIEGFHEQIPENALSFSVSNLPYQGTFTQVREMLETLGSHLFSNLFSLLDDFQDKIDFHISEDFLSLLDNRAISISLPAVDPSSLIKPDMILLLQLKDTRKAQNTLEYQINRLLEFLNDPFDKNENVDKPNPVVELLKKLNIRFSCTPFETDHVEFGRKISVSLLPMIELVFGIYNEYLFLATSENILNSYCAFIEENGPNINANPAFSSLNLDPPKAIDGVSFMDTRDNQSSILNLISVFPTVLNMVSQDSSYSSKLSEIIAIAIQINTITSTMHYRQYQASYSSLDAERGCCRIHTVTSFDQDISKPDKK